MFYFLSGEYVGYSSVIKTSVLITWVIFRFVECEGAHKANSRSGSQSHCKLHGPFIRCWLPPKAKRAQSVLLFNPHLVGFRDSYFCQIYLCESKCNERQLECKPCPQNSCSEPLSMITISTHPSFKDILMVKEHWPAEIYLLFFFFLA